MGNDIPGLPLLDARVKGMTDVIKAQRPNVTIVGPLNVGAEPTDNYNHWNALVKAHPSALAFMEPGDQGAVSFRQITQQTGQHYLVGGCDVDPTALLAVQEGSVGVLGDPWHFMKGYVARRCWRATPSTRRRCRRAGGTRAPGSSSRATSPRSSPGSRALRARRLLQEADRQPAREPAGQAAGRRDVARKER